jgi:hypothetical protein
MRISRQNRGGWKKRKLSNGEKVSGKKEAGYPSAINSEESSRKVLGLYVSIMVIPSCLISSRLLCVYGLKILL